MPDWPHAPPHRTFEPGAYFITAATRDKELFYHTKERLDMLHDLLLGCLKEYGWRVQAWAVLANHYHVVACCDNDAGKLSQALNKTHTLAAKHVNKLDNTPGRQVWFQYRDTALTFRKSYFARLNYTHKNAAHHGLVSEAKRYPWCSAEWFQQKAPASLRKMVQSFKTDRINVRDDFDDALSTWNPECN